MSYTTHVIEVDGKSMPVLLFQPEGDGPHPGLVIAQHLPVAHEGLEKDPFQLEVGHRYARAGFACSMPFLFHHWPSDAPRDQKVAEFRDDWTVRDLLAARALLSDSSFVDRERIGIVGHCWGGRVAWLGACHDRSYRACGVFYGGRIKLPFADGAAAPISLAANMRASVLGVFGNDDASPSPEDVDDYERALIDAGVAVEFHRYDGAGHGFQDFTAEERYRPEAAEDAWQKAIAFFKTTLG